MQQIVHKALDGDAALEMLTEGLRSKCDPSTLTDTDIAVMQSLYALNEKIIAAAGQLEATEQVRWPFIRAVHDHLESLYAHEYARFDTVRQSLDEEVDAMCLADRLARRPRCTFSVDPCENPHRRDMAYLFAARIAAAALGSQFWGNEHTPDNLQDVWLWIEQAIPEARKFYAAVKDAMDPDDAPSTLAFPTQTISDSQQA